MHLGHAAQGIGVLHPVSLGIFQDLAVRGQKTDVLCHLHLADLPAYPVYPIFEGVELAGQSGQRQRTDQIRETGRRHGIIEMQRTDAGHGAGAVGDAETFLAHQSLQRLDPGAAQRFSPGQQLALIIGLAKSQQHQTHVG